MNHIALLRGINVGGNNKIPMKELVHSFEAAGMSEVCTYIASGNVLFKAPGPEVRPSVLAECLEARIQSDFGLEISVLVLDGKEFIRIAQDIPESWQNNTEQKSDVLFLWPGDDRPEILDALGAREGVDRLLYVPGAVLWNVDRPNLGRSRMVKLVGTKLYKSMTVRNVNTVRKLVQLLGIRPSK